MTYQRVDMWRVLCDRCGISAQDDGDYWAWADKDAADVEAGDGHDWLIRDGKHWCPDCLIWDDDQDERVPLPALAAVPNG